MTECLEFQTAADCQQMQARPDNGSPGGGGLGIALMVVAVVLFLRAWGSLK